MNKLIARSRATVNSLLPADDGNAAEYGLIVGLVSVVIIGALIALGLALSGVFADVTGAL